jgi:hypothetical protein
LFGKSCYDNIEPGFLNSASPDLFAPFVAVFRQGLKETGYVDWRLRRSQPGRPPSAEFVRLKVDVILTHNTAPAPAAKQAWRQVKMDILGKDPSGRF